MRYWLSRGEGEVIGPFTAEELAAMHARGELRSALAGSASTPMVCAEVDSIWRPIASIAELAWMAGGDPAMAAPPSWPPPIVPGADPLHGVPLTFGHAFGLGWSLLQARYGILLAATAIAAGLSFVGNAVVVGLQQIATSLSPQSSVTLFVAAQLFNWAYAVLVNLPISVGCLWMAVRLVRGEQASLVEIGQPFRRIGALILVMLFVSACTLLAALPGIGVMGVGVMLLGQSGGGVPILLIALGAVLVLGPVVWLGVRLSPAYLLILDPQASVAGPLGPIDAIRASWALTQGVTATLIGILVVLGLIVMATLLACCLPWIFLGNPLYLGVLGATYALLISNRRALPVD